MNHTTITPRTLAMQTLLRVSDGQYGNLAVDATLRRHALSDADRSLYTALVYGVIERQITLDYLITRFSDRPVPELDGAVRMALRLGLYQLIYLDRIPDHAALAETVSLVPRRQSGFVNAVLRAYLRFEDSLPSGEPRENGLRTPEAWSDRFPDLDAASTAAMSVAFGMPEDICRRLTDIYGRPRAAAILSALGDKPPMTLACNPLRTDPDSLLATLAASGSDAARGLYAPGAVRVSGGTVTALPGFDTGDFFVQDEASQLCVLALDARPGQLAVDTCACPGSKSFGIALSMKNCGELHAFDLHESKLSLITSGAARLGLDIIEVARRDARDPDPDLLGRADRVLCDVPCSGLGVIAKKPEIRHKDLTEAGAAARLPAIQADILAASARYLKPGGVLVYSTCTILPEENGRVVAAFLADHPDFEPYDFSFPARSPEVSDIVSERGTATLLPDANRTDGFFIARLRRRA